MSTQDLTAIAYQVVSDLLGVVHSGFDVDATAQHQAAALILAGLVEAQRLASGSEARQLAKEWQEVLVALTEDALQMAEVTTVLKLKDEYRYPPFFAGKLSLLRTLRKLADDDAERFATSTYPVEAELLRAQIAASEAQVGVCVAMQQLDTSLLQAAADHWYGRHTLAVTLEQKLKVQL